MNLFRKTLLTVAILSVLLCNAAFADEITDTDQNAEGNVQDVVQEKQNEENISEEEQTNEKGTVAVDILNIRSGPSTDTEILGKLSFGTTLELLSENGDNEIWYEINFDSKTAYVCGEYINIIDGNSILDSILADVQSSGNVSVVEFAKKYIGTPYLSGGSTPAGFDCSGFVQYVMSNFGIKLPRTSTDQYSIGVRVDKSQLVPGDLVYFKYSAGAGRLNHVGIYVGNGNFIHSTVPGQTVRIDTLTSGYFSNYYYGATRVIK
jgi:cell wall-associated NlpC family hydrolase